jgi:protease IV
MSEQGVSRKGFWSRVGAALTTLRVFVANALFVLLLLFVLFLMFSGSGVIVVPEKSALVINPRGILVDQRTITDSLGSLLSGDGPGREVELNSLLTAVERAAEDDRISMLVLRLEQLEGISPGYAETLGQAIRKFSEAGKETVAYGNVYSQGQYHLASFADAVFLHPMGQVLLPGYGGNNLYFKDLLEKLKVNVHVFRVGRFKEFVEPYTRMDMSPEAREANQTLVDSLWQYYSQQVIANRRLSPAQFESYTQEFPRQLQAAGSMATAALENLLVDELLTPDAMRSRIASQVGYDDQGEINGIGYTDYLAASRELNLGGGQQIAVITASGPIVAGKTPGAIAADQMIEMIREVRRNGDLEALVLRLDTPGGSSFASELIRQELELLQLAGKPVVVSMSNVAASGGYWIASTTDRIVAQPTTITGSIGVFGLVPTFENSLSAIGVGTDGVATTPLSGADIAAGLTPAMTEILQTNVEITYKQFLNLVARGRDMTPEQVDEIAQGRVWIGSRAQELGLVDELGNLQDAIVAAAGLAGLDDYGVQYLSVPMSAREMLLREFLDDGVTSAAALNQHPLFAQLSAAWRLLNALDDPLDSYALCESCPSLSGLQFP